jgi:hypothetical protein
VSGGTWDYREWELVDKGLGGEVLEEIANDEDVAERYPKMAAALHALSEQYKADAETIYAYARGLDREIAGDGPRLSSVDPEYDEKAAVTLRALLRPEGPEAT